MEMQNCKPLQKFDDSKTEILKKRLLKTVNIPAGANLAQHNVQQNVLLNALRAPISSSMIVTSMQAPQSSVPIAHNLVTHSLAPVKIHTNSSPYPLQLSTVHVPVQIPGSASNINVPVQIANPTVSLPIQVSGTTSVPVQLSSGETISFPHTQNIQLTGTALPSMPILQSTGQPLHSSFIHVHMGSNQRATSIEGSSEMNMSSSTQLQLQDGSGVQVKMNNAASQMQMGTNQTVVQIPNSSSNSIQLTLPSSGSAGAVQLRGGSRPVPHVVYIQTPSGLKPVTNTEVISQASTSGNPPQIIVRRPVTSSGNIHLISNVNQKPQNIAPKMTVQGKSSILSAGNVAQPIVIQKPKDKMMVPVSISTGGASKQAIAYLGPVKKTASKVPDTQSILLPNTQPTGNTKTNQKLFLTPMNMPKMQNTKFILPVSLPATMASKGPIINLQIANGQIQNDPQGNITVMRDPTVEASDMPPLQPLGKATSDKESPAPGPQPSKDKAVAVSITGSRAESTGEQEYTLSIPETTASMNDDVYTVSLADDEGGQLRDQSFTLAIPEKGRSLLNRTVVERSEPPPPLPVQPAPAILRRSNSDNSERKIISNASLKRRISLCVDNSSGKHSKLNLPPPAERTDRVEEQDADTNDEHRVPSLFCDEMLDKDLEPKAAAGDSDTERDKRDETSEPDYLYRSKICNNYASKEPNRAKRESVDSALEEDPPGLVWSDGVAELQGSALQFQTNEFGLIDVIDGSEREDGLVADHAAKYQKPLKQRPERGGGGRKATSPEDLYRCEGCGCHGMAAEFVTPDFCSLTCQSDVHRSAQKKRDRERTELLKKRNKMRKLLASRQPAADPDPPPPPPPPSDSGEEPRLTEHNLARMCEDAFENDKYPWMCGKNGFSWMRYLEYCKAKAAPVKLFRDPFPYVRNGFRLGMRLEAIDPRHPSLFCVATVVEVQGFRMRLHLDGYPDLYDFWVNADSPDIFPCGWCERNGRTLQAPPPGTAGHLDPFQWPMYLKQVRSVAAPRHLFSHVGNTTVRPNGFRTGMKLEAEDRKNSLVCVATVADMMDNRLLVNFDSWDEMYDYWVDPTSPYIHPVGWAEESGVSLTPPNFYKDPDTFTWESYLTETGAAAAPPRAFKTRPPLQFKVGMKLEVVDPRVPFLIRVATISAVKGHQVRVTFDGWPDALSHWTDDDSPDIHPVGWCLKTGHPLEPPLTDEELSISGPCGVGGCRGLGSLRGGGHKQHGAASACPYRPRDPPTPPPDRLARPHPDHALPTPRRVPVRLPKQAHASTPTSDSASVRNTDKLPRGRPPKHKRVEEVTKTEPGSDEDSMCSSGGGGKRWRRAGAAASHARDVEADVMREYSARPGTRSLGASPRVDVHIQDLALPVEPTHWTQTDVTAFVSRLAGRGAGAAVSAARLTGLGLLMTSCEELVECARLRLGPAVKVYAAVRQLRDSIA